MYNKNINITIASMFIALIAVAAQIRVQMFAVPFTLQTLAIITMMFALPYTIALTAISVYVLAGFMGLPVFSNFQGGIGILTTPTGGYILGFVAAVAVAGLIKGRGITFRIVQIVVFNAIVYICGSAIGAFNYGLNFFDVLYTWNFQFIIWDLFKGFAALLIYFRLTSYSFVKRLSR